MSIIEKAVDKLTKQMLESLEPSAGTAMDNSRQLKEVSSSEPLIFAEAEAQKQKTDSENKNTSSASVELDLDMLAEKGFVTPDVENRRIAEELRMIKRRLLINASGLGEEKYPNANLILVSSASSGEGKTFLSVNLAMSIAMEIDRTALLVDADVAKSSVAKTLGFDYALGLTDYLTDDSIDLSDILLKTNVDRLAVLPAGKRLSNITEQVASDKMKRLMLEISRRYSDRIIIFDGPPLLSTTSSNVLAGLVGQVVVVAEANRTTEDKLLAAIDRLDHAKAIGLVLNKYHEKVETDYYGDYNDP